MKNNLLISSSEKLSLYSNLSTMLTAGIPIVEVIDSMLEGSKGNQKIILETIKSDLNQGKELAESFKKFPNTFDPIAVNIVKVAEEAGTLDTTLKDLAKTVKKDTQFINKIKAALLYPLLVLTVFGGVLIIILTFVIPRVSVVFTKLRIQLPLPTRILILTSNFLISYFPVIIIFIAVITVALFYLYRSRKRELLSTILSLPVISKLGIAIDLTRFTRSLSLLLVSGIPITDSLKLSGEVINNKKLRKIISSSQELVSSGKNISDSLKKNKKQIPALMVRIVEAGEKSGTLDKSMQDLSVYFDTQVSSNLKSITVLFEPVLLVIIGLLIGGVMLAIIAPIYGLIGQIGGR